MPTLAWACCHVRGTFHAHASVGMAPGMAPKPVILTLAGGYALISPVAARATDSIAIAATAAP